MDADMPLFYMKPHTPLTPLKRGLYKCGAEKTQVWALLLIFLKKAKRWFIDETAGQILRRSANEASQENFNWQTSLFFGKNKNQLHEELIIKIIIDIITNISKVLSGPAISSDRAVFLFIQSIFFFIIPRSGMKIPPLLLSDWS